MDRLSLPLLLSLTLACQREAVEVTCVYEDQNEETGELVETGDTGEAVEESALVTWDGLGEAPCDDLKARQGLLLDAAVMADVIGYTVLLKTSGQTILAQGGYHEEREDGLYWITTCDDEDTVIVLIQGNYGE